MAVPPERTCIVYCRTSTTRQKEQETIQAQVSRCRRLLEIHGLKPLPGYGPQKDGWLLDDGVTGTLLDGRHMASLLDDLEKGRAKPRVLVVYSLSRISRVDRVSKNQDKVRESHLAAARIQAALVNAGVAVIDEEGEMEPSSFQFQIKAMLANEEFKLIRGRTMSGKSRLLSQGKFAKGGKPPYGYLQVPVNKVDRKAGFTLEPHPEDARRLAQILSWFCERGVTYAARMATEEGFPSPMATTSARKNQAKDWSPTRWSPVSVQHIVRNAAAYLGSTIYEFDGERHTVTYPPIINAKLFAQVETAKRTRTLKKRTTMLTTGYVDCSCGAHVHAKKSSQKHYASCAEDCGSMRQEHFETLIWTMTVCRLVQIQRHEGDIIDDEDAYQNQIDAARGKVTQEEAKIERILDLYLEGTIDKPTFTKRTDPMRAGKEAAQQRVDQLLKDRDQRKRRRAFEETLESRVKTILQELLKGNPTLEKRRRIVGDILQGDRVIVTWDKKAPKRGHPCGVTFTVPGFGALPPVKVRADAQNNIWDQMLGGMASGFKVTTRTLGIEQQKIEETLLRTIERSGGTVLSRREGKAGEVILRVEQKTPVRRQKNKD